jgi:hypothetical protein
MEFEDVNIFEKFNNEWWKSFHTKWKDFIAEKDLGIVCIGCQTGGDHYKIIDEKKWAFNRIKYGI